MSLRHFGCRFGRVIRCFCSWSQRSVNFFQRFGDVGVVAFVGVTGASFGSGDTGRAGETVTADTGPASDKGRANGRATGRAGGATGLTTSLATGRAGRATGLATGSPKMRAVAACSAVRALAFACVAAQQLLP